MASHRPSNARISPLSAATLLLLITMVMTSAPAAPSVAMVRSLEDRPFPASSAQAEVRQHAVVSRRRGTVQQQVPTVADWCALIAPAAFVPVLSTAADGASATMLAALCRVRVALLDLPPPAVG